MQCNQLQPSCTHLAHRPREVPPVRRDVVVVARGDEGLGCDTFLDPAHDRGDNVVLGVVRQRKIDVERGPKGVRAYTRL